ncbi:30S ribosomal protein S2 [Candidatus Jorgensenbacteria bacterium GWA1_54_12]|uniref:Small ribosomal subunit protein uS2 n=1 Tax=Candidatus Jorgensenbacteria bacterium GWA1_54_12 TaxID=1798468 RepID=A0A1F6BM02_9BACT|nr:MAG: 30S ribosomal protein S2 [Candidatus Jorgensenbacteria bacterium GWA1_54_12]
MSAYMEEVVSEIEKKLDEAAVEEMARRGVLFSHKRARVHPGMQPYISANRHEVDVLDAESVLHSVARASAFMAELKRNGGVVLCVGTTVPAQERMKRFAENAKWPYVTHRWLGGTLTNFTVIRKRIDRYLELERQNAAGEFKKRTKKEQSLLADEIGKMKQKFSGLASLTKRPDALFVIDVKAHAAALREAAQGGVPVIAIVDSDDDPRTVAHPIIANDHAVGAIAWVMERLEADVKGV